MFAQDHSYRAVSRIVLVGCIASFGIGRAPTAVADDAPAVKLPGGLDLEQVDFRRHVLPLLSKLGCNSGNCHGSFQGRGGFRLSLFGHAPDEDFEAISDRIDTGNPDESLFVAKPSLKTDHGGGQRFKPDSWEYRLLSAWIAQGSQPSPIQGAALPQISVAPHAVRMVGSDATSPPIEVRAHFDAGNDEIVTPFCRLESSDPGVVAIADGGYLRSVHPGRANIIISYAGGFATLPVTVPFPVNANLRSDVTSSPEQREGKPRNLIDRWVEQRLDELNLSAAPASDDAQFLRRATLDVVGRLPTVDEICQFRGSGDPQKRAHLIDRLLEDPQHASLWATRMCDVTGCSLETMEGPDELKRDRARMWHTWFRRRLQSNMPVDQIVRGVLCGTSRRDLSAEQFVEREVALVRAAESGSVGDYAERPALDLYWRRIGPGGVYPREQMAERTAAAFLGIRIECARCHKHPYDRWTQPDYASFVNVFAAVTFGSSIEVNRAILARLENLRRERVAGEPPSAMPRLQEVYDDPRQSQLLADAKQKTLAEPRLLGGRAIAAEENGRDVLADWLTQPDNPHFARNWVNRVWAHYFGRGFVEPVDNFSARNPPTHPELLDALATGFIEDGFDMRSLEKTILNSHAYQQTSAPPASAPDASRYYACATVRPLMAEAMVQSANQVLGSANAWGEDVPEGGSVWDVGASRPANPRLAYLLELFGRGRREFVCDCNRSCEATLRQTLHMMSDAEWIQQIQASVLVSDLAAEPSLSKALESAYLRTLSRPPVPAEEEFFVAHVSATKDRNPAWVDVVWALLNSREFRTNH